MTKHLFAFAVFAAAACGDNHLRIEPDAGVGPVGNPADPPRAVVVSGNFTPGEVGIMSALDLDAMQITEHVAPNGAVAEDPIIRYADGELFVINRNSGNNITILDSRTFAVKEQLATGAGSNPQDVAAVRNKLYVPAFGTAGVVVLTRGSTAISTIDLSSLDPDGQPNCVSAFRVVHDVYVACELLDENFSARGPGKIVVIDTLTDTVRATVTMTNANPFGVFERMPAEAGGDLVIPTVPSFFDATQGCVERIAPGSTPVANGCVVTNQALGGFVSRIDFQLLGTVPIQWMVVNNGQFGAGVRANLQGYDLAGEQLWPAPISPDSQLLVDAVVCPNGLIVVADQTMASNGLRVYDGGSEKTSAALAFGLKPNSARGLVCY